MCSNIEMAGNNPPPVGRFCAFLKWPSKDHPQPEYFRLEETLVLYVSPTIYRTSDNWKHNSGSLFTRPHSQHPGNCEVETVLPLWYFLNPFSSLLLASFSPNNSTPLSEHLIAASLGPITWVVVITSIRETHHANHIASCPRSKFFSGSHHLK